MSRQSPELFLQCPRSLDRHVCSLLCGPLLALCGPLLALCGLLGALCCADSLL